MRTPSPRQYQLAEELIIESKLPPRKRRDRKDVVVDSGYTLAQAEKKQKEIIESEGVKTALAEKGFTVEAANEVVAEVMLSKKTPAGNRLQAADMVYKTFGTYAANKNININGTMEDLLQLHLGKRKNEVSGQNLDK